MIRLKSNWIGLTLLASFCVISCTNSGSQKEENRESSQEEKANPKLVLNNGEKWKVSESMIPALDSSFKLIDLTSANNSALTTTLAGDLIALKDEFVSSCDMTGEGHNVLHAWLIPYIGLLDELKSTKTEREAQDIFDAILMARHTYPKYFE